MNNKEQIIEVIPYDLNWPKAFKVEASRIKPLFSGNFIAIYHIGSTAVPGLSAKPTIDIILEVKNINLVDAANNAMTELGYEALGEYGIIGRRLFIKGEEKRTHHIHTFQTGNTEIYRHLCFRDYLIAHPADAKNYAELKINLAWEFSNNREAYVKNKHEYIKVLEQKALKWCNKQMY
jgi:GrpB-like predicted nucleotidyltransferase (UPF0157 family)